MTENEILLKDAIRNEDELVSTKFSGVKQDGGNAHKGMRTAINIENELGEQIFSANSSVIGGSTWILERLFNTQSSLSIATINSILGINGVEVAGTAGQPSVCLFGVGTGGAPDTVIGKVFDVDFKSREIPGVIPFRLTDQALGVAEQQKYAGRKLLDSGKTAYYFKRFEADPVIKSLWLDSQSDDMDGTPVEENVHESARTEGIETFVEIVLKIDVNDCREHFSEAGEIERSRMNSIGLYIGTPYTTETGEVEYKDVRLFSLLNINTEALSSAKELNFRYRVYSA